MSPTALGTAAVTDTQPRLPTGFWTWLADIDPEDVPFRAHVSDPEIAELIAYARHVVDELEAVGVGLCADCGERVRWVPEATGGVVPVCSNCKEIVEVKPEP